MVVPAFVRIWGRVALVVLDPSQIVGSNVKRRQVAKDRYG